MCQKIGSFMRNTPGGGIAKVPTENPEPRGNQGHIQAHVRTHTRTREISEGRGLRSPVFSSERTRANFALVPTVQMANGAIRAELPVESRRSDGPVGFAGPYGRNLMQAPPRIRVGSEFFCGTSGLPIRAFRACGCCWPMPRTSPRTPLPRVRSSLWPWQYAADAFLLVHTVLSLDASRGHFGVAD